MSTIYLKKKLKLIAATRKSMLALWQTNYVIEQVSKKYPSIKVSVNKILTKGDIVLDKPLNEIGGKSLFMKELEISMQDKKSDFAVHSLKDVPFKLVEGFELIAFCKREDPHDALVSNHYKSIDSLPLNAKIGTSSLRRKAQLLKYRPDLNIIPVRGNVQTRLKKLDDGMFDGIILAAAGLIRLNLAHRISEFISKDICLPAVGQGVIVIEAMACNVDKVMPLKSINDRHTEICVIAERIFNQKLEGGCHVPIAAHAIWDKKTSNIKLCAFVSSLDGKSYIKDSIIGSDPHQIGYKLAQIFIDKGANQIIKQL